MSKGYAIDQVLSFKQTTVLAPQLQQGVHILNLSSIDLQTEVDAALERNPFLEKLELDAGFAADTFSADTSIHKNKKAKHSHQLAADSIVHGASTSGPSIQAKPNSTASQSLSTSKHAASASSFQMSAEMSLQTYLYQQAQSTPLSDKQHYILEMLVDSVNDNGYLRARSVDIIDLAMPEYVITKAEVFDMIRVLQDFEPVGVGARSASECLLIQLRDAVNDTPGLLLARQIIKDHLPLLAKQKFADLATAVGLAEEELSTPIALIKKLNPFPGASITSRTKTYVTADLILKKLADRWVVRLNPNVAPAVSIHNESDALLKLAHGKKGYKRLKQEWQNAQSLLSNLERRYRTILQVAQIIVERQNKFFDQGETALRPLAQKDIAQILDVHISTVSRAVNDKYILTPNGTIQLRYFFSTAISKGSGETVSSKAVQAMIVNMIEKETVEKPLSDKKIAVLLNQQGIPIARRTVTKYREQAGILASPNRRIAGIQQILDEPG